MKTDQSLETGQQICFDLNIRTATIISQDEEKTIASAFLYDGGVIGGENLDFQLAPTLEEIEQSKNVERTFDKIVPRPINDAEYGLMHDYLSLESEGKKGMFINVDKSNFVVYDISENNKKVVLTELYLCKENNHSYTETIVSIYSINEGVVILDDDFSSIEDSGDVDISEIKDIL